jgi:predicted PurR-regulated permease PerM
MNENHEAQRVKTVAFYAALVATFVLAYRIVQPFLVEVGWAIVLAICFEQVQSRMAKRIGANISAALLCVVALLVLIVPLLLVAEVLVRHGSNAVSYVEAQLDNRGGPMGLFHVAWDWLHRGLPFLPDEQEAIKQVSDRLGALAQRLAVNAGLLVGQIVAFAFNLGLILCILFFLLKDGPAIARGLARSLPFGRERNERLLMLVRDIVSTSVTSTLLMAVLQGVLGGLAFYLLGVPGALLWGCAMGLLATLPAVGAALVWAPTAVWLALSGSVVNGLLLALFGLLVLGNTDNVVRTLMLSGKSRMNPLVLIMSLLGGVVAFGFIGVRGYRLGFLSFGTSRQRFTARYRA